MVRLHSQIVLNSKHSDWFFFESNYGHNRPVDVDKVRLLDLRVSSAPGWFNCEVNKYHQGVL